MDLGRRTRTAQGTLEELVDLMKWTWKDESEWKEILSDEQFDVCRNKSTEIPFSGKYYETKDKGVYKCICCNNNLFKSNTKFDSLILELVGQAFLNRIIVIQ